MSRQEILITSSGSELFARQRNHPITDIKFLQNGIDLKSSKNQARGYLYEDDCREQSLRLHPELFGVGAHFLDEALANRFLPPGCSRPDYMGFLMDSGKWELRVMGEAKSVKIHGFAKKMIGFSNLAAALRKDERILPYLLNDVSFPHFVFPEKIVIPDDDKIVVEFSSPSENPKPHKAVPSEVILPKFSFGYNQVVFSRAAS